MQQAVAFDAMGTLFDVSPVTERFGSEAMPRLLHAAAVTTLAGRNCLTMQMRWPVRALLPSFSKLSPRRWRKN